MAGNSYGSLNAFGGGGSGSGPSLSLNYNDSSSLGGFYVLYDELADQADRVGVNVPCVWCNVILVCRTRPCEETKMMISGVQPVGGKVTLAPARQGKQSGSSIYTITPMHIRLFCFNLLPRFFS